METNAQVLIILLALGKLLKSTSFCEKIINNLIPFILLVVSMVLQCIFVGFDLTNLGIAITTAVTAVGIHQTGKITLNTISSKGEPTDEEDDIFIEDDIEESDDTEEEIGE